MSHATLLENIEKHWLSKPKEFRMYESNDLKKKEATW